VAAVAVQTYPISSDGLALPVMIGLSGFDNAALLAVGQPITAPVLARALIDTGSDVTCVAAAVPRRLGLQRKSQHTTQTISGPVRVDIYEVSFSIPGPSAGSGPLLVLPQLLVMEWSQSVVNVEVLIGLDVLLQCELHLDGPGRQFTLSA
jgi:hypothetical protein